MHALKRSIAGLWAFTKEHGNRLDNLENRIQRLESSGPKPLPESVTAIASQISERSGDKQGKSTDGSAATAGDLTKPPRE